MARRVWKLSYSKPVYMARLVQEDNKHGDTANRFETYRKTINMARHVWNYNTASQYTWPDSYRKTINMARRI